MNPASLTELRILRSWVRGQGVFWRIGAGKGSSSQIHGCEGGAAPGLGELPSTPTAKGDVEATAKLIIDALRPGRASGLSSWPNFFTWYRHEDLLQLHRQTAVTVRAGLATELSPVASRAAAAQLRLTALLTTFLTLDKHKVPGRFTSLLKKREPCVVLLDLPPHLPYLQELTTEWKPGKRELLREERTVELSTRLIADTERLWEEAILEVLEQKPVLGPTLRGLFEHVYGRPLRAFTPRSKKKL